MIRIPLVKNSDLAVQTCRYALWAAIPTFDTIVCQHHRVSFLLQSLLQKLGHLLFILDDQDSHLSVSVAASR